MGNLSAMQKYLGEITRVLARIEQEEAPRLAAAADAVADVICRDGLIFTFGCGHSHLPCLDTFYRAGGLACVSPMLDDDLMLLQVWMKQIANPSVCSTFSGRASHPARHMLPLQCVGRWSQDLQTSQRELSSAPATAHVLMP